MSAAPFFCRFRFYFVVGCLILNESLSENKQRAIFEWKQAMFSRLTVII